MKKEYVAPEMDVIQASVTPLCDFSPSNDKTFEMGAKEFHAIIDSDEEFEEEL